MPQDARFSSRTLLATTSCFAVAFVAAYLGIAGNPAKAIPGLLLMCSGAIASAGIGFLICHRRRDRLGVRLFLLGRDAPLRVWLAQPLLPGSPRPCTAPACVLQGPQLIEPFDKVQELAPGRRTSVADVARLQDCLASWGAPSRARWLP